MIRWACGLAILMLGIFLSAGAAQEEVKPIKKAPLRFGFELTDSVYSQKTPKDAMKSVAVALARKRTDYMLAHLVDPVYVDYWIDRYKAEYPKASEDARVLLAFDRLVQETNRHYLDDPLILKELRLFSLEAEWTDNENHAVGTVKSIAARKVFMRRIGERWFLENRQQAAPK